MRAGGRGPTRPARAGTPSPSLPERVPYERSRRSDTREKSKNTSLARPRASLARRMKQLVAAVILGLGVVAVQPPPVMDALARLAPGVLWSVPTTEPLAALTFDDGPDPRHTPQVLDILKKHGVRATFFLIG